MPRIVYIAGYGRSGSTLLDVLLGHHPAMFGAGELTEFFGELTRDGRCSCGQPYSTCPFWEQVIDRLKTALPDLDHTIAEQVTRRVENSSELWRRLRGVHTSDRQAYATLWNTAFATIERVSGACRIADSSKSSRETAARVVALSKLCGLDVQIVHLVRDPRAVMWSVSRGSNAPDAVGQKGRRGGLHRMLAGWSAANLAVHVAKAADSRLRVTRVRYEDLAARPVETLQHLGAFLEIDVTPVIESVVNQRPFDPGHGVGGNRMRRHGPVRIVSDEEWKTALPGYARLAAPLVWPLARAYGYDAW